MLHNRFCHLEFVLISQWSYIYKIENPTWNWENQQILFMYMYIIISEIVAVGFAYMNQIILSLSFQFTYDTVLYNLTHIQGSVVVKKKVW